MTSASGTVSRRDPAWNAVRLPHVEMVVPCLDIGGMEILVVQMVRALARRGYGVGVTCLEYAGDLAATLVSEGHRVSVVPTPGLKTIVRAPALARHFAEIGADVVHAHNGVWEKAARAARLGGVRRVIATLHGLQDPERWYFPLLLGFAARSMDRVVAVSAHLERHLVQHAHVPASKVRVLINGIDTDRFHPGAHTGALRERLGIGDAPLVGTVARLHQVKNHLMLVSAFGRLLDAVPDAHLAIVGDGEMRPAIEARVAELGLGGRVHLPGMMTDLAPVHRDLDAFVLSSFAEGTSVSMLEAMSTALGVVATRVGGNAHLLDGGACGVLVPSDDAGAMAGALATLLGDRAERARLGAAARARVIEHFSERTMLDEYEALYFGAARPAGTKNTETIECAG